MTELLQELEPAEQERETVEKVSIVVSKGSLEGIYPALIMANGARMEGIEADLFFTFFGLDAIRRDRYAKIKVATVGNPGMHLPTLIGVIPGLSWLATKMMSRQMEKLDIPGIREFLQLLKDAGAKLYACGLAMEMFKLEKKDLVPQVDDVLTAMDFFDKAEGAQIIFT